MLTHASMDVGNIISIVIPESPDENINIDQLTGEFRQQLERIKKQSRASKVEHGLVTLKRVLPEMSREEKRKTLPLIRRVLHGRRVANPGPVRNLTRDPRLEQMRENAQFLRSRSAGNPEERRMHRDYQEEPGAREAAATRVDQTITEKEDYRRGYASRRDDFPRRDESVRDDRVPFTDEDPQSSKILRTSPGQEWSPNWDDQYRGDGRAYPESSTVDCNYKLERTIRQKDPVNEIVNDRYVKSPRLREPAPNGPEENPACEKFNQGVANRYPSISSSDTGENSKRNVKDSRGYETGDSPAYASQPREFDPNAVIDPNCDDLRKINGSAQLLRDLERSRTDLSLDKFPQREEQLNPEPEDYRYSLKSLQDSREQSDRLNVSRFDNAVNEGGDDYGGKKKRGQNYGEEVRGVQAVNAPVDRWNGPIYEDRGTSNSSDEPRDSPNAYEMAGEKSANLGFSYIQTEQGGFRRNLDKVSKTPVPRMLPNYGTEGLALRIQRAINDSRHASDGKKLPINVTESSVEDLERMAGKSIFEHLKRLFKPPQSPGAAYDRVIVVYGSDSQGKVDAIRETVTEDGKSQSTPSPSMAEPSASTRQDGPVSTTGYIAEPRVLLKI